MKKIKIAYYIFTGLLTALMLFSVIGFYFLNTDEVREVFSNLGFPAYIVIPLGIAKLLGVVAIWTGLSHTLKSWAYAGFFFDFVLAASAHIAIGDGGAGAALVALVLLMGSFFTDLKISKG
ncbi:MAG: DoxX family protein [Cyclobacteriaceae bacterium]